MTQTSILTVESAALDFIKAVESKALNDEPLTWDEAVAIIRLDHAHIFDLIASADHWLLKDMTRNRGQAASAKRDEVV